MKIAIVASLWIKLPPSGFGFGAQEYLAYQIAEGMVKKGHEVTVYATGDSTTSARLVSVTPKQLIDLNIPNPKIRDIFELISLSEVYKESQKYDIVHNHLLPYGLLFANTTKVPTVHTLHHTIYTTYPEIKIYQWYKNQNFVSISDTQRKNVPELNYVGTVYNGVDPAFYSYQEKPKGNYLFYIGRMKRYKGIHTAIKLAGKLGLPLKIASPLPSLTQEDHADVEEYWEKEIKPKLSETVEYLGCVEGNEKVSLLQNAKALIFPIEWEESFGMTLIESMSCGTPIISYALGAVPEIVEDGKNGFLINHSPEKIRGDWRTKKIGFNGLIESTHRLFNLPDTEYLKIRLASRKRVESLFTTEKMVNAYEKVYKNILEKTGSL